MNNYNKDYNKDYNKKYALLDLKFNQLIKTLEPLFNNYDITFSYYKNKAEDFPDFPELEILHNNFIESYKDFKDKYLAFSEELFTIYNNTKHDDVLLYEEKGFIEYSKIAKIIIMIDELDNNNNNKINLINLKSSITTEIDLIVADENIKEFEPELLNLKNQLEELVVLLENNHNEQEFIKIKKNINQTKNNLILDWNKTLKKASYTN